MEKPKLIYRDLPVLARFKVISHPDPKPYLKVESTGSTNAIVLEEAFAGSQTWIPWNVEVVLDPPTTPVAPRPEGAAPRDLVEFQDWVRDTALYPKGLSYPVATLASEAGECQGEIVKAMRAKRALEILPEDLSEKRREKLLKELSDTLWGLCATANELGLTLYDFARINFEKLEERRREGELYRS